MLDSLVTHRPLPPSRVAACEHDVEHHLSEGDGLDPTKAVTGEQSLGLTGIFSPHVGRELC
jgi:hypothetical protein